MGLSYGAGQGFHCPITSTVTTPTKLGGGAWILFCVLGSVQEASSAKASRGLPASYRLGQHAGQNLIACGTKFNSLRIQLVRGRLKEDAAATALLCKDGMDRSWQEAVAVTA